MTEIPFAGQHTHTHIEKDEIIHRHTSTFVTANETYYRMELVRAEDQSLGEAKKKRTRKISQQASSSPPEKKEMSATAVQPKFIDRPRKSFCWGK